MVFFSASPNLFNNQSSNRAFNTNHNGYNNNKRPRYIFGATANDVGDQLAQQMERLTTQEVKNVDFVSMNNFSLF